MNGKYREKNMVREIHFILKSDGYVLDMSMNDKIQFESKEIEYKKCSISFI